MSRKAICALLLAALLLPLPGGCARQREEEAAEPAADAVVIQTNMEAEAEPALYLAEDAAHPALMALKSDGRFHPNSPVTKEELCAVLYPLLDGLKGGRVPFSDVKRSNGSYRAIAALYRAGLLPDADEDEFHPGQSVTRAYLAALLHNISDALGGEDAQRVRLLAIDVTVGMTAAEGADISDGAWVNRRETAVILTRMMGREPNAQDLFMNGCVPADVTVEDPAWSCMADVVTEGTVGPVSGGVHRLYGWLYAAWDDGTMITDLDYGVWTFGPDGRYTTGDEVLDMYLADALEESGANDLPDEEALKAAYLYIKYDFQYLVRPEDMETIPVGVTGWEYDRAKRFFRYGGGTCYGYAAAFGLMARALGQHAYVVAAEVNQFYGAHGFVVIPEGDTDVIYDVELEATRPERHDDFDLYGILNKTIYNYWYVANWREQ